MSNESELSAALLDCDGPAGPDRRQIVGRILERDRMRVRFLAWAAAILWSLAAGGVVVIVWCFLRYLEPKLWLHANTQETEGMKGIVGYWVMLGSATAWSIGTLAATMLAAAIATVSLVFASRRATLRQVNAQLAEISAQLQHLRQSLANPKGHTPGGN